MHKNEHGNPINTMKPFRCAFITAGLALASLTAPVTRADESTPTPAPPPAPTSAQPVGPMFVYTHSRDTVLHSYKNWRTETLNLSEAQQAQVANLLQDEMEVIGHAPRPGTQYPVYLPYNTSGVEAHIRTLLIPEQQKTFDTTIETPPEVLSDIRMDTYTELYNLTEAQQDQLNLLLKEEGLKASVLLKTTTHFNEEPSKRLHEIRDQTRDKLYALLTPEQQKLGVAPDPLLSVTPAAELTPRPHAISQPDPHREHTPEVNRRLQRLTQELDLTEGQQARAATVLELEQLKESIFAQNRKLSPEELQQWFARFAKDTQDKLRHVLWLSSEQQEKFDVRMPDPPVLPPIRAASAPVTWPPAPRPIPNYYLDTRSRDSVLNSEKDWLTKMYDLTEAQQAQVAAWLQSSEEVVVKPIPGTHELKFLPLVPLDPPGNAGIRYLLTPEQRKMFDTPPEEPRMALIRMRTKLYNLSPEQQSQTYILLEEEEVQKKTLLDLKNNKSITEEIWEQRVYSIDSATRRKFKALLTPEQQEVDLQTLVKVSFNPTTLFLKNDDQAIDYQVILTNTRYEPVTITKVGPTRDNMLKLDPPITLAPKQTAQLNQTVVPKSVQNGSQLTCFVYAELNDKQPAFPAQGRLNVRFTDAPFIKQRELRWSYLDVGKEQSFTIELPANMKIAGASVQKGCGFSVRVEGNQVFLKPETKDAQSTPVSITYEPAIAPNLDLPLRAQYFAR
jgi:Spy/CpxP family protein refolding chaperone